VAKVGVEAWVVKVGVEAWVVKVGVEAWVVKVGSVRMCAGASEYVPGSRAGSGDTYSVQIYSESGTSWHCHKTRGQGLRAFGGLALGPGKNRRSPQSRGVERVPPGEGFLG
jgi:hypothetical protein